MTDDLDAFLSKVAARGLSLYPAQEEAILELHDGANVVLDTPTGSGKSLVAEALHHRTLLRDDGRSYYTAPTKALVNEKFLALCESLGADHVGIATGDGAVNPTADVVCCTAEVLASIALREGRDADVASVVMDEFHYYGDRDRGVAWQVPLLELPQAQFLLMSATLGDCTRIMQDLERRTGRRTVHVRGRDRPVPLAFDYAETPLLETLQSLVKNDRAPVYVVAFTQRASAELAQDLLSTDWCSREEKKAVAASIEGRRFDTTPYGRELKKLLMHGIAVHHAGLLPRYRLLVERLARQGLLKVICGTDTLGVGVNVPIRTVLFTALCKYDGEKTSLLTAREFHQIAGRAGRRGFDAQGWVVCQAPEHVIENLRLEAKAARDGKKKFVRRKPPEHGFVPWDRGTFERLQKAPPEALSSRFEVTHRMLLDVLRREQGCRAMIRLVRDCHDGPTLKKKHRAQGLSLYRSLVDAGVITVEPDAQGISRPRVHSDYDEDFSLDHALSLWIVETLPKLDLESDTYAMDVVTLAESVLEQPDIVLRRQVDKLKTEAMAAMKAEGVEFEERVAKLDLIEHPKPLREFVYETFNAFAKKHPWVGDNIRPKSVAREMLETFAGFSDYVKLYGLQRSEGVLLRYLSDVYKTLLRTVPSWARTVSFDEAVERLGLLVRQTDASLLDEWERIRGGHAVPARTEDDDDPSRIEAADLTTDPRKFTVLVRNTAFRLVHAFAHGAFDVMLDTVDPEDEAGQPWNVSRLSDARTRYREDHDGPRLDGAARGTAMTEITREDGTWRVLQRLCDTEGHDDWFLRLTVDLARSRTEARVVARLESLGP